MTTGTIGPRTLRLISFGRSSLVTLARAHDHLAERGLDVETTLTPNSTEQMRGVGEGRWDMASTAFDNVLAWSGREGAEFVAVAQAGGEVELPLYVRPEVGGWEALRGSRIAVDAVDTAFALVLRRMLLDHGLDMDRGDYELVPEGATGARLESMQRGETVAAIINPPWSLRAEDEGFVRLASHRDVVPDYPRGIFAVTRSWAAENADALAGFLGALEAARRWAGDAPEEAAALLAAEDGTSAEAAAAALGREASGLGLDLARLGIALDLRLRLGLAPPLGGELARYVDGSFFDAAG